MYESQTSEVMAQREERYRSLFAGELDFNEPATEANLSIAALCRVTYRAGRRLPELDNHLAKLPQIIDDVLSEQDHDARSDSAEAIFAFTSDEARKKIGDLVAGVIKNWEITMERHGNERLVKADDTNSSRLIVEAAAAAVQAVGDTGLDPGDKDKRLKLVSMLSCRGPLFAREWIDGTVVRRWLLAKNLPESELREWQTFFTRELLINFSKHQQPLSVVERVMRNYDYLTPETVSETLRWSFMQAKRLVTPGNRRRIAIGHLVSMDQALENIKDNLDNVLTDENIAERLGWKINDVRRRITPIMIRRFALINISDPLEPFDRIKSNFEALLSDRSLAELTQWDMAKVKSVFTEARRVYLAVNYINKGSRLV